MEIYLNVAEWGDGIFGIEAAARHYYHKSAKNLTADEASRLAAVLPNPIRYNPTGNQKYVKNRARIILKTMKRRGVIQSIYKEVMTPPKEEKSTETNSSVESLFDSSTNDTPVENSESIINESPTETSVFMSDEGNGTK